VVAVCGDGGFLLNVQGLETAKRLGTAAVVLVDGRLFGHSAGIASGNPDLVQLARAFDLPGFAVTTAAEFLPTLRQALALEQPTLIAVPIEARENLRLGEPL
jgi:acetolactate synthase-1/2/3 large subunit